MCAAASRIPSRTLKGRRPSAYQQLNVWSSKMLPQGYAPAKQRERVCLLCARPRAMRNSRKRALTGLSMTAAHSLPIPLGMVKCFCLSAVAENSPEPFPEAAAATPIFGAASLQTVIFTSLSAAFLRLAVITSTKLRLSKRPAILLLDKRLGLRFKGLARMPTLSWEHRHKHCLPRPRQRQPRKEPFTPRRLSPPC